MIATSKRFAESYDADYATLRDGSGDVAFYVDLAQQTGGPVLELGCGTGRVLLPIAKTGLTCVGVDPSPDMLDVFRRKSPPDHVRLVRGGAADVDIGERFAFVFCAFRVFQHFLDVDEQLAVLDNVSRHLAPEGRFAFDVFAPDLARIAHTREPEHEDVRTRDGDDEWRRIVWVERDLRRQIQRVWFRHERWRHGEKLDDDVSDIAMRWFHRYELEHLLARAGFVIEEMFGGFDRRPYDGNGEIIVVARRR